MQEFITRICKLYSKMNQYAFCSVKCLSCKYSNTGEYLTKCSIEIELIHNRTKLKESISLNKL